MVMDHMSQCPPSLEKPSSPTAAESLIEMVESACRRLGVGHGPLVVAVSGGPDSVALARAFKKLQASLGLDPLILAHLNHQLRGEESDQDESFVAELAEALQECGPGQVRLAAHRVDMRNEARRVKDNLEKVAREVRYAWLGQVSRQEGARWIATGHTANDQAETVLHRLLRGSGLKGLRGIAENRPSTHGLRVIRPMLDVTRSEVMDYLQAERQNFRQDSSNSDRRLTRNRIRHELLPFLEKGYNGNIVATLCRLAKQAEATYGRVKAKAESLLSEAERPRAGSLLIFDRQQLSQASRSLVREAFRLAWEREGWPLAKMRFEEWDRLTAVALGETPAVDLPGGIRAVCRDRVVQIGRP
jgi:tRNA(Ile)-lysidine synthase